MSFLDKVIAAVTPPESEEARAEARRKARSAAGNGDWLSMILDQHLQVESAFAAVKAATDRGARVEAQKWLATLLTGHSNAEEAAIYPALAEVSEKVHATAGYSEQAAVKVQLGLLERMDPMSSEFLDKLEHIKGAVQHHVYAEESNWFLDLKRKLPAAEESRLTRRYKEEFERYMGADQAPRESMSRGAAASRTADLDRDITAQGGGAHGGTMHQSGISPSSGSNERGTTERT